MRGKFGKIVSFKNEMKWNETQSWLKVWVQKIFSTLPPIFGKGHDKSHQKISAILHAQKWAKCRKWWNLKSVLKNLAKQICLLEN